ncbi:hypothetical protein ABT255_50355 [Streptomyces mirabilis]|uniref:hypothetical protein n=1 Tax=Streptomyces mirabilis TaxID=68239 RepID=UPI00332262F3
MGAQDVARRLGLLTDTDHPAPARQAWDAVKQASAALAASDKALWDLRLGAGAGRETAMAEARAHLDELERRDVDALPAVRRSQDRLVSLLRAHAEDDAGAGHEGWDRLRGAFIEQARESLEQTCRGTRLGGGGRGDPACSARARPGPPAGSRPAAPGRGPPHRVAPAVRRRAGAAARPRDIPEPDAVTFVPPKAPVLPSTATKAPKPVPPKTAAPAARRDAPPANPRRAHAAVPWQPRHGARIAEDDLSFDASGDHRTLIMTGTDGGLRIYDLHPPRVDAQGALLRPEPDGGPAREGRPVDGNGFWEPVGLAGERTEQPLDLALRAAHADPLGEDTHLYRRAVFHVEEVEVAPAAFVRDPGLRQRICADGGRLPDEVRATLTAEQTRALLATTLVMARRWDQRTAARAAALAARTGRHDLIVVEEDGSHRRYTRERAEDPATAPWRSSTAVVTPTWPRCRGEGRRPVPTCRTRPGGERSERASGRPASTVRQAATTDRGRRPPWNTREGRRRVRDRRAPSTSAHPPAEASAPLLASLALRRASLSVFRSSCVSADRSLGFLSHPLSRAWEPPSLREYDHRLSPGDSSPHPAAHFSRWPTFSSLL